MKTISPEDKTYWVKIGNAKEPILLLLHPEFCLQHCPDAYGDYVADDGNRVDLKTQRAPWRFADKMFRISPPENAFTVNLLPLERYDLDTWLILWPEWMGDGFLMWRTSVRTIRKWIAEGKAKRHEYNNRPDKGNGRDIFGNNSVSYVIDLRWCESLPEPSPEAIQNFKKEYK